MSFSKTMAAAFSVGVVLLSLASLPAMAKDAINTNGSDKNIAISGLDTVAFFTQKKSVHGNEGISYEWKGAKWLFASETDRKLFAANPEKYAPQWGGYCAVGISDGHVSKNLVKGSFDIRSGKLYLFAESHTPDPDYWRKVWLEKNGGPSSRVTIGDANWKLLKSRVEAGEVAPKLAETKSAAAAAADGAH
jgi:YHS domain-containing protein